MDRTFLLAETRQTPMHVGGLQIFRIPSGAPTHFVSLLAAKLRTYPVSVPPLNYRLAEGFTAKVIPSWEIAGAVDIDYHFRHSALPQPGGERELGVLVSRLHSNPMDLARPLWEYHLIEGLSDHRFAVYTKLHHALVDGVGAMRLAKFATDPADSFAPPFWGDPTKRPPEPRPRTGSDTGWMSAMFQDEVQSLPSLVDGLVVTARTALGVGDDVDLTALTEAPRTMLNVRIDGQRRVATFST
ncbi:MAG: wax ester/triacylglycerol synthase domain-containing protein, partial [Steroidobacteraceae bacterium]